MSIPPSKTSGFTLIELLLVLMALAVVASLAIPAWFDGSGRTLENATKLLAHDLREAQNRAAYHGREVRAVFPPSGDGYRIEGASGMPERAPLGGGPYERNYAFDGIFRGVHLERVELGGDRTIVFAAGGFADEGGLILVTFGGKSLMLTIESGSGLMAIEGLDWVDPGN